MQDRYRSKSLSLSLVDNQPDPERIVAQREIQRLVERAIDRLPQHFRMVLVMRIIEGMSVEETAELLGIRPETVKTRLHRARALLKARLENDVGPQLTDSFPFAGERCLRLTARALKRLRLPGSMRVKAGEPRAMHRRPRRRCEEIETVRKTPLMTEFRNPGADFCNRHRSLKSEHCHSPKNDFS
jgi:hypothetical protein